MTLGPILRKQVSLNATPPKFRPMPPPYGMHTICRHTLIGKDFKLSYNNWIYTAPNEPVNNKRFMILSSFLFPGLRKRLTRFQTLCLVCNVAENGPQQRRRNIVGRVHRDVSQGRACCQLISLLITSPYLEWTAPLLIKTVPAKRFKYFAALIRHTSKQVSKMIFFIYAAL